MVEGSFLRVIEYLRNNVYNVKFLSESSLKQIKKVHDAAYILAQWKLDLEKCMISDENFSEMLSISIQMLHACAFKDEKLLYILLRSLIENFFKYSKKHFAIENCTYTNELYERLKKHENIKDNQLLKQRYINIWNYYQYASNYVHSNTTKFLSLYSCVQNYIDREVDDNFRKCTDHIVKVIQEINCILILIHPMVYHQMERLTRELIIGFNSQELKIQIHSHFFNNQYSDMLNG